MTLRGEALDATLMLLRRALGQPLSADELDVIRHVPAQHIARVASAHSIVNLLGGVVDDAEVQAVLDPDLVLFLREMRQRNTERNALLRAQLLGAATRLARRDIACVALKGGAELIAPLYPDPADRFLSDIDILVPAEKIQDAIAALEGDGYTTHGAAYHPNAIHAPALWHEAWPTAIELHTALCEPPGDQVVIASDVLARAIPSSTLPIATPTRADRLAHLIVHAQVHSRRYRGEWLLLRDLADLAVLASHADALDEVRARFTAADLMPLFDSFLAAAKTVLGAQFRTHGRLVEGDAWAARTLELLRRPDIHRARLLKHWLFHYSGRFFGNAALRRKYLTDLKRPQTVKRFVVRHWDSLKGLQ